MRFIIVAIVALSVVLVLAPAYATPTPGLVSNLVTSVTNNNLANDIKGSANAVIEASNAIIEAINGFLVPDNYKTFASALHHLVHILEDSAKDAAKDAIKTVTDAAQKVLDAAHEFYQAMQKLQNIINQ